jgi:hypothetical protein
MKGYIKIIIPVRPFVRGYITNQYGINNAIKVDKKCFLGKKIFSLLSRVQQNQSKSFANMEMYKDQITIYISKYWMERRGCDLNADNIKEFNTYFETQIKERFIDIMNDLTELYDYVKPNIETARHKLGIEEDDWENSTLEKIWYRYRVKNASTKTIFNKQTFLKWS